MTILTVMMITELPVLTIVTRWYFKTNPGTMEPKLCTVFNFDNYDKNAYFAFQAQNTLIEKDHLGDWSPEKDFCSTK